jgi:hypothetical protein
MESVILSRSGLLIVHHLVSSSSSFAQQPKPSDLKPITSDLLLPVSGFERA